LADSSTQSSPNQETMLAVEIVPLEEEENDFNTLTAVEQVRAGIQRVWWYQKSRQFLGKNKTKLNCSRNPRLPFQIHLCWCVIVKRLMQALLIVKREIFT